MKKENFIEILTSLSKEDIRNLIKEKGKEPKLIAPITFLEGIPKEEDKCR